MFRPFLIVFLSFLAWAGQTAAAERVALVVGNVTYSNVSSLKNAANDARLMSDALTAVGFQVTLLIDADRQTFERAISDFGKSLRGDPDTVGLFYYAGHGVQSFGTNYLLPVDTALSDQADLDLVAIEANSVLRQMYTARNRTNIVILDACRDNPFVSVPDFTDNGLAEMKAPTGTFLSYSTAPGMVAFDGADNNSPFTTALAQEISAPGATIEQVFKNVRISVLETTGGAQTPWDASSLTTDFRFMGERKPAAPDPSEERALWAAVKSSGDAMQLKLFLRVYPDGAFAKEAATLLASLEGTPPAPEESPKTAATTELTSAESDLAAFEAAQSAGTAAAYRAYLDAFPNGVFAEMAAAEFAARSQPSPAETAAPKPAAPESAALSGEIVTFLMPIRDAGSAINGQSLAALAAAAPAYPPVEGLPDSYWKSQSCAACHQWTKETLCEQGAFYVKNQTARNIQKQHPFGGAFKQQLRNWAQSGCK